MVRNLWVYGATLALALMFGSVGQAAPAGQNTGAGLHQQADLPPVGTVTRQLTRGPQGRVVLMSGVLTAPSASAPATIASGFLATNPSVLAGANPATLRVDKTVTLHSGQIVRYQQTYKGLPVVGGSTAVRLDHEGRVRWISSGALVFDRDIALTPTLSSRQALTVAARRAGYAQDYIDALDPGQTAQLAIYYQPVMDGPRLAYWIELPQDLKRMQTIRAFVDAETGTIYRLENKVVRGGPPPCGPGAKSAYVYEFNPVETPDLMCVSLQNDLPGGATTLGNADVTTGNCIDNNDCREFAGLGIDVHWCTTSPVATTNAQDDFTNYVYVGDTEIDDEFAEVQMFYHVNKVYALARTLGGFTNLNARPLDAFVNFQLPIDPTNPDLFGQLAAQACLFGPPYTGGEPLYPFDNAAFIPAGGLFGFPDQDSIVFGQGTQIDFSYDGDVVYHEFGHAVMNTVAPGLSFGLFDPYGFDPSPGGMHEGYADLMSMFVTDDPEIGEYAGVIANQPFIRNIDNTKTCPVNLVGETHYDSEPMTGAFWEIRTAIATTPGDKTAFDQAVFAAQESFDETDNFESAAMKTVAEIELAFGAQAATTAETIFAQRGMDGCNNRIADGSLVHELLFVGSAQGQGPTVFPAPIQSAYELTESAESITITTVASQVFASTSLQGDPPILRMGMKADQPVVWSQDGGGELVSDFTTNSDVTVEASQLAPSTVTFTGPFAPGTYYFQYTVEGGAMVLYDVTITHVPGGGGDPDAGPTPDAGTPTPDAGPDDGDDTGGCCSVGERDDPTGSLLLGLLVVGAIFTGRRRRRRD